MVISSNKDKVSYKTSEPQVPETNPRLVELNALAQQYGFSSVQYLYAQEGRGFIYHHIQDKYDLRELWSQDVMAYIISWPGAEDRPGTIQIVTHMAHLYEAYFLSDHLIYEDLRGVLPHLPKKFEDLKPWEFQDNIIDDWQWFGIHSGCWMRAHISVSEHFYKMAEYYNDIARIKHTWPILIIDAIYHRSETLRLCQDNLPGYERINEYTLEDANAIKEAGILAWRESDQGWCGLFCRDGKSYFKCAEPNDIIKLPIDHREEIRNNTLPGWQCIYCGLGHRVMIREDFYKPFVMLTYGSGKQHLWDIAFNVLAQIIKQQNQ